MAQTVEFHAIAAPKSATTAVGELRHLNEKDVFDCQQTIIFQDDFKSGLSKWKLSINAEKDHASLDKQTEEKLIRIEAAPDSDEGRMAVRCVVPRTVGTFRSEIALPHEDGFQERWYGVRIYVPKDWVFESDSGGDIVMQWKALTSEAKQDKAYPPLSIAIKGDRWVVNRSFGAMDNINHNVEPLDGTVEKGRWVSWVIHVKWSLENDGLVQIWKDRKQVIAVKGPNTYSIKSITPYFKTGLYHPQWKRKNEDKFNKEVTTLSERVIYTADVKIGNEHAKFEDVSPGPEENRIK